MSKHRVVVEAVLSGKSQREVARLYGLSQPRVAQLLAAWRTGGWQALEPQSRRPKTNPRTTPPAVVQRIMTLRKELIDYGADAGPHSIHAALTAEMNDATSSNNHLAHLDPRRPDHSRTTQTTTPHLPTISKLTCPTKPGNQTSPDWRLANGHDAETSPLARRPLPIPHLRHRPQTRHRRNRVDHLRD